LWHGLALRAEADPGGIAVVELGRSGVRRQITWGVLQQRVQGLALGLVRLGVRPGDRVSLLIPVSVDLVAAVYACWRIGAAVVVTDAGLGLRGMRRAIAGAHVDHVIGIRAGLAVTLGLGIPGRWIRADRLGRIEQAGLDQLDSAAMPPEPDARTEAVIAFTSGATGPAKGVVYRHWQVERTRDAIVAHYGVTSHDGLIAAFAPWAVLGPALQIASAIPAMDVTRPSTLTARALADAAAAVHGTLLWSSPAALANVIRTESGLNQAQRLALQGVRIAMFAGAPVPVASLRAAQRLFGSASVRTPYGMTEALPLTDVTLAEIEAAIDCGRDSGRDWESGSAGHGDGVLVGRPIDGVEITIAPLGADGRPGAVRTAQAGVTGEICVRCDHMRDHYDNLWAMTFRATDLADGGPWHRTGDVGHLDDQGRLWVSGRLAHVIGPEAGPVTPVGIEQRVEELAWVLAAAAVGVGPPGCQQVVVVVTGVPGRGPLIDVPRTLEIRDHLRARGLAAPVAVLRRLDLGQG
ncbi:MAG: AMP-binding protein, partial [Actinomycetales bacterium]